MKGLKSSGIISLVRKKSLWACLLVALAGCVPKVEPPVTAKKAMVRVTPSDYPEFRDDLTYASLEPALDQSLAYLRRLDPSVLFQFGPDTYTAAHLIDSLQAFSRLVKGPVSVESMNKAIRERFLVYRSIGSDGKGDVLFTGYYEPVLQGSLTRSPRYPYPIYRCPEDLVTIDLSLFGEKYGLDRLVGRHVAGRIVPYFERDDIDSEGCLDDRGYALVWISSRIDLFFLQIQGSGRVVLEDGTVLHVNYACSNGRPYRSIGKLLIDEEKIPESEMSAQRIRAYLKGHPEEVERILNHNASYVFFRLVDHGPLGAIEVPLTAGRCIATDLNLFPAGALAFVETEKPASDGSDAVQSWEEFSRFVLNQDTGGAIRGPGRADFFWGNGAYARRAAGHMKQRGTLYFIVAK